MKHKALIIGLIAALAIVLVYLLTRKASSIKGGQGCITVPGGVQRWQGDMAADWGAYGPAKEKYIGVAPDSTESALVDGFFKAIDVQPHSKYVRKYSRQIKEWLESGRADKHWMVEQGELRCLN